MDFLAVSTISCYFMEVNFSISLPFPEKKEGRKRKTKENNNNCSPKKNIRLFWPAFQKILNPKYETQLKYHESKNKNYIRYIHKIKISQLIKKIKENKLQ